MNSGFYDKHFPDQDMVMEQMPISFGPKNDPRLAMNGVIRSGDQHQMVLHQQNSVP